jgi:hypothetical protein
MPLVNMISYCGRQSGGKETGRSGPNLWSVPFPPFNLSHYSSKINFMKEVEIGGASARVTQKTFDENFERK